MEAEIEEEKLAEDLEKSAVFRDSFSSVRAKLQWRLAQGAGSSAELNGSGSVTTARLKLPKLDLPHFDGKVLKWESFWQSFECAVDESELPEVQKLTYLRSLLSGEAKQCVEGLPLKADSYSASCELLKKRFGRKELVIFSHIQELLNITSTTGGKLKELVDQLLVQVRSLEALGVTGKQYGVIMTLLLLSRLPSAVRLEWARTSVGKEGDLEHLLDFLQVEIARLERSGSFYAEPSRGSATSSGAVGHQFKTATTASRGATSGGAGWKKSPSAAALQTSAMACPFCGGRHHAAKCPEWCELSCRDRFLRVREARLCFCCLAGDHVARTCNSRCGFCRGKYHTLCCFRKESADQWAASQSVGPTCDLKSGVKGASSSVREGVTLSSQSGGDRVVLPTATVQVLGPGGRSVSARMLFDSGADRTFVSEKLVRKVDGKWRGSVEMQYAAFGGGRGDGVFDAFELGVTTNVSHSVPTVHNIEAVRVPIISAPLQRPCLPANQLAQFSHLPLADSFSGPEDTLHIDILVGQDQYWSLVGAGLFRSPEGLVALETVFGWVICGKAGGGPDPGGPLGGVSCQLLTLTSLPVGRKLWSCDRCDVDEDPDGESVLREFEESVSFSDGRYEVKLPWKSDGSASLLESNRELAETRLMSLSRKLDRDPELKDRYDSVLQEMEESDMIVEVPADEIVCCCCLSPPSRPLCPLRHGGEVAAEERLL